MITYKSNVLTIDDPVPQLITWITMNLSLKNPEYYQRLRMGKWIGNVPESIKLYEWQGKNRLVVPYGCLSFLPYINDYPIMDTIKQNNVSQVKGRVSLYDYQSEAMAKMLTSYCGILQAPPGSGKTQIALALAQTIHHRTLWITHTKDLLTQSYNRAREYFPADSLGKITEGKIECGEFITFATVQTLCGIDLDRYRDYWDCIIVDECHRVCVSAKSVGMFQKVLNNLSARWKYGLSATVHRSDGLIFATIALLGKVIAKIDKQEVGDKIVQTAVQPIMTEWTIGDECLETDGMLNYSKMLNSMAADNNRNIKLIQSIVANADKPTLVLSARVEHLHQLYKMLPIRLQNVSCVIDGGMTSKVDKLLRERYIEQMRTGEKSILFATYQLAKEGLDIPRLEVLHMATPQNDYAVVAQSIGRIARAYEGKAQPVCFDYIDKSKYLVKSFKKRLTTYRKENCEIREVKEI